MTIDRKHFNDLRDL